MSLFVPKKISWKEGKDAFKAMDENMARLKRIDAEAKKKSSLLWRFIREPHADGAAFYQIIRVNKGGTVRIKVCTGIGDDWVIPYWGEEATIDAVYALNNIKFRDLMAEKVKKG